MSESTTNESQTDVRVLLKERRYGEAITALETLLESNPDCDKTLLTLGTACFAEGRLDDAKKHFERLVRLRPADVNAYVNLGAVLNRAKDYRAAIDALRRGLQRDRKCAAAYYNMGIAHRGTGNRAMAVTAYRDALDVDPDMVDAHLNLGNVLLDMGNHQQAVLHYNEALLRKPGFEKALRGLAKAENAAAESRKAFSPFGRLVQPTVDEPATASAASARRPQPAVALNPEERSADRRTLLDISSVLTETTGEVRDAIRGELEGAITHLNKAVASGKSGAHLVSETHEDFQKALATVRAARASLERAVATVVAHEEEIGG